VKLKTVPGVGICLVAAAIGIAPASATPLRRAAAQGIPGKIDHLVVIYEENHSFDNLWGLWPGVNGLGKANRAHTAQVGEALPRKRLRCLPQNDLNLKAAMPPSPVCTGFPNQPFLIDTFIPPDAKTCPAPADTAGPANGVLKDSPGALAGGCTRDLAHRYYQEQYQIDGGRQDRYVTGSDAVGLAMGVYDTTRLSLYQYLTSPGAPNYVIADDFFQGAFGGSFLNHQFLIAAAVPVWPGGADKSGVTTGCATGPANCDLHSVVDGNGMPKAYDLYKPTIAGVVDGALTTRESGDFAVNTIQPTSQPFQPGTAPGKQLPPLETKTIGDELSARGLDWAWYAGGWDNAAGITTGPGWTGTTTACAPGSYTTATFPYCPNRLFQFHHQPFNYFDRYRSVLDDKGNETNQERIKHLKDEADFLAAVKAGQLPAVSFVKPLGPENEHPGYTGVSQGDGHLVDLLKAIKASPDWATTAVVVTYDEFGGAWDHVSPPNKPGVSDRWGPGTRIPAMILSPQLHQKAAVDHTPHDTTSILATIEHRWGLAPLGTRDAADADLGSAFHPTLRLIRIRAGKNFSHPNLNLRRRHG